MAICNVVNIWYLVVKNLEYSEVSPPTKTKVVGCPERLAYPFRPTTLRGNYFIGLRWGMKTQRPSIARRDFLTAPHPSG